MKYEAHHLGPHSDAQIWTGWADAAKSSSGQKARRLPPGETKSLLRDVSFEEPHLGIVTLAAPVRHALHLVAQGRRQVLTGRDDYPLLRFALLAPKEQGPLEISNAAPGSEEVLIHAFHLLPLPGMRSAAWLPPVRRLLHKITGAPAQWSPADFPCSHFDGLKYLQWNPDVQQSMLDRKCRSALQHYLKFGRREARAFPFAVDRPPNPGSILNLAHWLRAQEEQQNNERQSLEAKHSELVTRHSSLVTAFKELESKHSSLVAERDTLAEENELLLLQLHQVQEELEQYFLANRNLQSAQEKLTALESKHSELVTRHTALVTSEKDLATRHSSLATAFKELESKHSSLAASSKKTAEDNDLLLPQLHQVQEELEHCFLENRRLKAEHSDLATERDRAAQERDALKKTASERGMRIAELEAQVADLAERQKQIDEEMAKAEGQLSLLERMLQAPSVLCK